MVKFAVLFDTWMRISVAAFCMLMLFLMVAFTDYTVVMRYVFDNPPVWGDLLTVLSNIWLVFIALALTVREKEHIALNVIYSRLPVKVGFAIQQFWTIIIFCLGVVICFYGLEVVAKMGGMYWEMWYFTWEDSSLVFKPNYMPKKYAMVILPIVGVLISSGAIAAIIEDAVRLKNGVFKVAGGTGTSE